MKGEFKTQESAFYCFYYNLDPDDLTKQERDNCIRQGCQLNKQLIAGKDTATIKFYKYWCKNNIYDFKNKSVVKNNTSNNGDVKIDKDGVLVQSVKELKVWNKQEECYDDYNEARVITILKILEDKDEQIRKALAGVVVSDLKYKITSIEDKYKMLQKEYKKVIDQRNILSLKMEGAGWTKIKNEEYDKYKKFYIEKSGL